MYPSTLLIKSGNTFRELSYTCFPVKLFRIVSDDRYSSLWWAECGSHFVVDVPRFEQEILRNDAVPEEDGFKTITFTSFIRQLNLYGFRKVSVDNDRHVDPRDWQRYAHPFFLRARVDYLDRIKRQPGNIHGCNRGRRNSPYGLEATRGYSLAMTQHLMCRGIRPSRKGPKPKYNMIMGETISTVRKPQGSKRRKQQLTALVDCGTPYNVIPFNVNGTQTLHAYMGPYNCGPQTYQMSSDGVVWETLEIPVESDPIATVPDLQGRPGPMYSGGMMMADTNTVQLAPEGWQAIGLGLDVPTQYETVDSISARVSREFLEQNLSAVQSSVTSQITRSQQLEEEQVLLFVKDQNLNQAQPTATASASSQFDAALSAAVFDEDVSVVTNAPQYYVIDDTANMKLWQEEASFHNSAIMQEDHGIFSYDPAVSE